MGRDIRQMSDSMVIADSTFGYKLNESAIVVVGLAWLLAIGSMVLAGWILCGWRGTKQISIDWWHAKATVYCR